MGENLMNSTAHKTVPTFWLSYQMGASYFPGVGVVAPLAPPWKRHWLWKTLVWTTWHKDISHSKDSKYSYTIMLTATAAFDSHLGNSIMPVNNTAPAIYVVWLVSLKTFGNHWLTHSDHPRGPLAKPYKHKKCPWTCSMCVCVSASEYSFYV